MHRKGFSIAEFLIAITITLLIVTAVIPVVFKKNAETINFFGKESGTFVCSCNPGSYSTKTCTFTVADSGSREFYTIQLLGGGAGGGPDGTRKGGGAGEAKVMYYPSMKKGDYTLTLGAGGAAGAAGSQTTISYGGTVLEYANGGITTNEIASTSSEKNGEVSTYSENGCGKGGNAASTGTAGEVIIRW